MPPTSKCRYSSELGGLSQGDLHLRQTPQATVGRDFLEVEGDVFRALFGQITQQVVGQLEFHSNSPRMIVSSRPGPVETRGISTPR